MGVTSGDTSSEDPCSESESIGAESFRAPHLWRLPLRRFRGDFPQATPVDITFSGVGRLTCEYAQAAPNDRPTLNAMIALVVELPGGGPEAMRLS